MARRSKRGKRSGSRPSIPGMKLDGTPFMENRPMGDQRERKLFGETYLGDKLGNVRGALNSTIDMMTEIGSMPAGVTLGLVGNVVGDPLYGAANVVGEKLIAAADQIESVGGNTSSSGIILRAVGGLMQNDGYDELSKEDFVQYIMDTHEASREHLERAGGQMLTAIDTKGSLERTPEQREFYNAWVRGDSARMTEMLNQMVQEETTDAEGNVLFTQESAADFWDRHVAPTAPASFSWTDHNGDIHTVYLQNPISPLERRILAAGALGLKGGGNIKKGFPVLYAADITSKGMDVFDTKDMTDYNPFRNPISDEVEEFQEEMELIGDDVEEVIEDFGEELEEIEEEIEIDTSDLTVSQMDFTNPEFVAALIAAVGVGAVASLIVTNDVTIPQNVLDQFPDLSEQINILKSPPVEEEEEKTEEPEAPSPEDMVPEVAADSVLEYEEIESDLGVDVV